jgi:hypothetical protein
MTRERYLHCKAAYALIFAGISREGFRPSLSLYKQETTKAPFHAFLYSWISRQSDFDR